MVDWNLAINVTVTGIVLVFSMLLLLVFVLSIFGWVSVSVKRVAENKAKNAREAVLTAMSNNVESDFDEIVEASVSDNNGLSNELVAVISAAVATMYLGSDKKPVIKTIKRTSGRRSAWGNAGVIDNTRAF